jgi:hypothetical protein
MMCVQGLARGKIVVHELHKLFINYHKVLLPDYHEILCLLNFSLEVFIEILNCLRDF